MKLSSEGVKKCDYVCLLIDPEDEDRVSLRNISQSYFTTDGQSVSMSWCRAHSGACYQILLPVRRLLYESWGLVLVERPIWREDGPVVCSAIIQWSESRKTSNHTLLSHLRLSNLEGQISPSKRVAQLHSRALGETYLQFRRTVLQRS
jgi:hypothetical protein